MSDAKAKLFNRWAGMVSGNITRKQVRADLLGNNKVLTINRGKLTRHGVVNLHAITDSLKRK